MVRNAEYHRETLQGMIRMQKRAGSGPTAEPGRPQAVQNHKRIVERIISHYDKVAFMTASNQIRGWGESTVVRLAGVLGYKGHPQLQKAIQR